MTENIFYGHSVALELNWDNWELLAEEKPPTGNFLVLQIFLIWFSGDRKFNCINRIVFPAFSLSLFLLFSCTTNDHVYVLWLLKWSFVEIHPKLSSELPLLLVDFPPSVVDSLCMSYRILLFYMTDYLELSWRNSRDVSRVEAFQLPTSRTHVREKRTSQNAIFIELYCTDQWKFTQLHELLLGFRE